MSVGKTLLGVGLAALLLGTASWGAVETISKNKLKNNNENLTNTVIDVIDKNSKLNNDKVKLFEKISQIEDEKLNLINGLNSANKLKDEALENVNTLNNLLSEKTNECNKLIAEKNSLVIEKNNLENEVNVLQSQVESLLLDKELYATQLETKTKDLEQKETDLQEIQARLDTVTNEVESLEEEISSLGVQLEEKNQEIENLNLTINSLNQTLANRNAQIEDLQERLRIADEASGVTLDHTRYFYSTCCIPKDSLILQSWDYNYIYVNNLIDHLTNISHFAIEQRDVIKTVYDGAVFLNDYISLFINNFTLNFYHNGTSISQEECLEFLNSLKLNGQFYYNVKTLLSYVNEEYILNIDFIDDFLFTGRFVNDDGLFIDFDTVTSNHFRFPVDAKFYLRCESQGKYYLHWSDDSSFSGIGEVEFIDDNSFKLDGVTYYKENTEQSIDESNSGNDSTENSDSSDSSLILEAPHSLNVSMELVGQDDTKSYYLKFENGTGFLRITNLTDTSDIQEITLEFVSWDSDNSSSIILKRTDTNEEIILYVDAYTTTGNIETGTSYKIVEATYKGVQLTFGSV